MMKLASNVLQLLRCFSCCALLISPQIIGGFTERRVVQEADVGALFYIAFDLRYRGLGGSEISCSEDKKLAPAFDAKAIHLAVGADLINPRIGARIRVKDHAASTAIATHYFTDMVNSSFHSWVARLGY